MEREFLRLAVIPEVINQPGTVIAVNVGGALIPGLISLYLYIRNRLWITGILGTVAVAAVCHWFATPVRGLGIALPVFVAPLTTAAVALVLSRRHAGPLAYISGSLGTLIGADLLNLGKVQGRHDAEVTVVNLLIVVVFDLHDLSPRQKVQPNRSTRMLPSRVKAANSSI